MDNTDTMNADVLACHSILKPEKPTKLSEGTPAWVKTLLQSAGWNEGDAVPTGLNDYFPQVLQLLGLPITPASAREIIKRDDVAMTLRSKLDQSRRISQQEAIVKERTESLLGKPENYSPGIFESLQKVTEEVAAQEVHQELQQEVTDDTLYVAAAEEEELPKQEAPTQEEKVSPHYVMSCPRCALSLMDKYEPIRVTDKEKEDYLFHVLGGGRYYSTMSLFNGLGEVTFQTLTAEEQDLVRLSLVTWESRHKDLPASMAADRYFTVHLPFAVANLNVRRSVPILPYTDSQFQKENSVDSVKAYMDYWYSQVVSASELRNELLELLSQFMNHVAGMREELHNRDFWSGVTVS